MIKAGIFDVGGVLHTNEIAHVHDDIVKTLGITHDAFEKAANRFLTSLQTGKITEQTFWEEIIHDTQAPGKLPNESLYGREFKKRLTLHADVFTLLHRLKGSGYKLAVLSTTIQPHVDILKKKHLFTNFDVHVFSTDVALVKPDPAIYRYALNQLNVKPEETFFVDDLQENIQAANKLGIHGILFKDIDGLKQRLLALNVAI